jgi:hypothetical protein
MISANKPQEHHEYQMALPLLQDHSMKAQKSTREHREGGIDLTPANMNLLTKNGGEAIRFHLNPLQLQQLQNAPGFAPVIINIQPMTNLRMFLGLNAQEESPVSAG